MNGESSRKMWTKDTIAGAILGCVACVFVQAQLQTLAERLNSPAVSAVLRWWPGLLVVAGLVLLSWKKSEVHRAKEVTSRPEEVANERRRTRNNAA